VERFCLLRRGAAGACLADDRAINNLREAVSFNRDFTPVQEQLAALGG
jgi:hypothetical protein